MPCYAEEGRDIGRLLDEMLEAAGLRIEPEARQMVLGLLGADRRLSRMEIDKLLLFGAGKTVLTSEDVEAIMTEASQLSVDAIVDAAFLGQLDRIEEEARRLLADGYDAGVILGFALRHAFTLQAILRDRNGNESIKAHRINWKREKAVLAQLDRWNGPRLDRVVQILSDAILAVRRQATLGEPTAIRAFWSIALAAGGADPDLYCRSRRHRASSCSSVLYWMLSVPPPPCGRSRHRARLRRSTPFQAPAYRRPCRDGAAGPRRRSKSRLRPAPSARRRGPSDPGRPPAAPAPRILGRQKRAAWPADRAPLVTRLFTGAGSFDRRIVLATWLRLLPTTFASSACA